MGFCLSNSKTKKKQNTSNYFYCNHEPKLNLNKDVYDKNAKQKFSQKTHFPQTRLEAFCSHGIHDSFSKYFNFIPKKREKVT